MVETAARHQDGIARPADRHVRCRAACAGESAVVGGQGVEGTVGAGVGGGGGVQQVVMAGRVEYELLGASDLREPGVREVGVAVQARHRARRPEEYLLVVSTVVSIRPEEDLVSTVVSIAGPRKTWVA